MGDWRGGTVGVGIGIGRPWCDIEIGQVYTYFDAMADAATMKRAWVRIAPSINPII
jgi:hypothetical protein